ncbi:DAO domain-containing protein [Trichoderma simmonsii]|uniref:DAO domain-containing protein n=1 Tax=Trichoderma simmonsii TaxID=1491479 RepID=A0A8G0PKQ7_9HYPO|nr:hypothetical protein Trihar35433_9284 [Trichoderma harzianum]QYT00129.1 DAO domain-containing protein [Trichoderma simmonsii]
MATPQAPQAAEWRQPSKHDSVIIVGAGAFGLSTALHLLREGYTDVTVLERGDEIPSRYSAANDINKIIRAEYEDPFYRDLTLKAIENGWRQPLFASHYHQTGYIVARSSQAPPKVAETLEKSLQVVESHPLFSNEISALNGPADFRRSAWQLSGPMLGFKGYLNRMAGYAHSGDVIRAMFLHCARAGVKFITGEQRGNVVEILNEATGTREQRCIGVRTSDGKVHHSGTTILALGAFGASLVPELASFTTARCWSVGHILLNADEADLLRGIPVVNVRDLGFFFEPDPATRLLKLCPLGAGYTNTGADGVSLPPADHLLNEFMPKEDEQKLRLLLRNTLPWLADRPFVDKKLCWFSDTADSDFCIDYVPGWNGSLVVLAGDSGHGFKMTPIVGEWVISLFQDGAQRIPRWRWRSLPNENMVAKGKGWGNKVTWRVGKERELAELLAEKRSTEESHAKL